MNCGNPYMLGNAPVACGRCIPCRINKRREWTHRMVLESYCHDENVFVTVTYDDDHLPPDGSVSPDDMRLFLNRLRDHCSRSLGSRFRFFGVGEYGEVSQRPHYHFIIFGMSVADLPVFQKAWNKGFVYLGDVTEHSIQYVAGYTLKKMNKPDLAGRTPEFQRQSTRPGLGALAIPILADALGEYGRKEIEKAGDVPNRLRVGKKSLILGRYLRSKLRLEVGMTDEEKALVTARFFQKHFEEMCSVFFDKKEKEEFFSWKKEIEEKSKGVRAGIEARYKIRNSKGSKI